MIKGIAFILFALLLVGGVSASTIYQEYSFNKPTIGEIVFGKQVFNSVEIAGLESGSPVGEPKLPFKVAKILIPKDSKIKSINVVEGDKEDIPGFYNVEVSQKPIALTPENPMPLSNFTYINPRIYSLERYPERVSSRYSVQSKDGYQFVVLNLYPIIYNPREGKLSYLKTISVEIEYEKKDSSEIKLTPGPDLLRKTEEDKEEIKKVVDNPSLAESYPKASSTITGNIISALTSKAVLGDGSDYDYMIITSKDFANLEGEYTFKSLIEWKISRGLNARIVTLDDIYTNYSGRDQQEKIRNFLKDAYLNWHIKYVLLGGDADGANVGGESGDNLVPVRNLWVSSGWDVGWQTIASDVYYSNLDGTFDGNGNEIYGELDDGENGGEVDLYSELYVGRAPVDSAQEISNFVRKTIAYENATLHNELWLKNALMVGEDLYWSTASIYKNEIKDGSDSSGYITEGFPESLNVNILYDLMTWYGDDINYFWDKQELINRINSGVVSGINHLGHASTCYDMRLCDAPAAGGGYCSGQGTEDIKNLQNVNPIFVYSQGCFPGAFDNWNYNGYYTTCDSAGEHFVTDANGAFAVIMNARYGWGVWYPSTDGRSQRHDRRFFDAIFWGQDANHLGKANAIAKEGLIGYFTSDSDMRGIYWETNLLGDPETSLYIPPKPEHEIAVRGISIGQAIYNQTTEINTTIKNAGNNTEQNVVVSLIIDNNKVDNITIDTINPDESYIAQFYYTFTSAGEKNVTIEVSNVAGDENPSNNQKSKRVMVPYVWLTGKFYDYPISRFGSPKNDSLVIVLEIDSVYSGQISYGAILSDKDDWYYIDSYAYNDYISYGKQNITLIFSMAQATVYQINGPYNLYIFNIFSGGGDWSLLFKDIYQTKEYKYSDFEMPGEISVSFDWNQDSNLVLNKTSAINVNVYNQGAALKEPVFVSLYSLDEYNNPSLIETKTIIAPQQYNTKKVIFSYTPKEIGIVRLYVEANISYDADEYDNHDYRKFDITIPSQIVNTGKSTIEGYLIMKLQYLGGNSSQWTDYEVVANDFDEQNIRTILPGQILDLADIWNSNKHVAKFFDTGEWATVERVYAAVLKRDGGVLSTEDGPLTASAEFLVYKPNQAQGTQQANKMLSELSG
jgi:hypothetical protein